MVVSSSSLILVEELVQVVVQPVPPCFRFTTVPPILSLMLLSLQKHTNMMPLLYCTWTALRRLCPCLAAGCMPLQAGHGALSLAKSLLYY